MIGVSLGFIRVDWEVDLGAVDMMLSSIAPEVDGISQHSQKAVMGCNNGEAHFNASSLLVLYTLI